MKKLFEKDKKYRLDAKKMDKQHFVLKAISKNSNLFTLIRWKALLKLKVLNFRYHSKTSIVNRCIYTINKKKFNKLTYFSRNVFLRQLRFGKINGYQKSTW